MVSYFALPGLPFFFYRAKNSHVMVQMLVRTGSIIWPICPSLLQNQPHVTRSQRTLALLLRSCHIYR